MMPHITRFVNDVGASINRTQKALFFNFCFMLWAGGQAPINLLFGWAKDSWLNYFAGCFQLVVLVFIYFISRHLKRRLKILCALRRDMMLVDSAKTYVQAVALFEQIDGHIAKL